MLGIPQGSPGGCSCPQQEQPNGVIATPNNETTHGQAPTQPSGMMGLPAGGGGMPMAQPQPNMMGPQPGMQPPPMNPGPYLGGQIASGGQQPQMQRQHPQMQRQQPTQPGMNMSTVGPHPPGLEQLPSPQLQEIQVIIMGEPNEFLAHWLMINGIQWRRANDSYDVDVARNRATREFLACDVPRGKKYMMMFDADMVPCGETQALLIAPGDLVFCGHVGAQGGRGHSGPGNFAAACFRVSLRCLQKMGQITNGVWWNMGKDASRSERTHCECAYFNHTAQQAGFAPVQVGVIGHMQTCIIFPVNNSPEQWKLLWPLQYRHMIPQGVAAPGGP